MAQCPCGSGSDLNECCGPVINGETPAATAEALMRSRFTAFVRGDLDHIKDTHAKSERTNLDRLAAEHIFSSAEWVSLEIFSVTRGSKGDDIGTVDFAARFKKDGALMVHRERSNFRREEGRWVYVDGEINPKTTEKFGRNQMCPCGSGMKYKKCCGV
jgi:SEC-C motif-containing protein